MSQLPSSVHAVVIGAGIHGLSTGWHLELERRRRGSGRAGVARGDGGGEAQVGRRPALRARRPPLVGAS